MEQEELHKKILELVEKERQQGVFSYNEDQPYQSYERIGFEGLRWSVEKRIQEYNLEELFDSNARVLDIGSNFGFFVCEFALHCREAHGIEHNSYLNDIGRLVASYLDITDRVKFFDQPFEDFNGELASYDRILSLAAFYTSDGHQRSSAELYFGKIRELLKPGGILFYESTSFPLDEENEFYQHNLASKEALDVITGLFTVEKSYEAPSGRFHRRFVKAVKAP